MWKLYKEYGSFKQVARKMRRSPDTASRHVREFEAAVGATEKVLNIGRKEYNND